MLVNKKGIQLTLSIRVRVIRICVQVLAGIVLDVLGLSYKNICPIRI